MTVEPANNPRDAFLGVERSASYAERVLKPLRAKPPQPGPCRCDTPTGDEYWAPCGSCGGLLLGRSKASPVPPLAPAPRVAAVVPSPAELPALEEAFSSEVTAARIPSPAETPWADAVRGITVLARSVVISYDAQTAAAWATFAEREGEAR